MPHSLIHSLHRDGTHFRYILNFLRDPTTFNSVDISPAHYGELKQEIEFYCLANEMKVLAKPMVLKDQHGRDVNVEQHDDRIWYAAGAPIIVCNNCEAGGCISIIDGFKNRQYGYQGGGSSTIIIAGFKSKINSAVQPVFPYNGRTCRNCSNGGAY